MPEFFTPETFRDLTGLGMIFKKYGLGASDSELDP